MCVTDLFPDTFALSCVRELLVCVCYFLPVFVFNSREKPYSSWLQIIWGVTSLVTREVQDE